MEVSVKKAAQILDIPRREVRRRLHTGNLAGKKLTTGWLVSLPDTDWGIKAEVTVPLAPAPAPAPEIVEVGTLPVGAVFTYNGLKYVKVNVIRTGEVTVSPIEVPKVIPHLVDQPNLYFGKLDPTTKVEKI